MRALAAAYAILAALAMPALIWASDGQPAGAVDPATTPTGTTAIPPPDSSASVPAPTQPAASTAPAVSAKPAAAPTAPAKTAAATTPAARTRSAPSARAAASNSVTIRNFLFNPASVTVSVGDTVTWTNQDSARHTATANDGSFDTGTLAKGQSGSQTFRTAGTFSYICAIHPNMKGTVVVQASSSGAGAAGSGSGSSGSSSGSSGSTGSGSTGSSSGTSSSGSSLPSTGLNVAIVGLAGVLLLGGGMLLRRRVSAD